jgi:type I restriction enzyme S subunit
MREGWKVVKFSDLFVNPKKAIISGPFGSNLKSAEYKSEGIPLVRLQNVDRWKFINKNIIYITNEKAKELSSHTYKHGDILISKLGVPLGKACIAPKISKEGIILADIVRVRLDSDSVDKKYLVYQINSNYIANQLKSLTTGATRPRVTLKNVRELNFVISPLSEQKQIVAILDKAFTTIDQAKANIEKNIVNAKELFQSKLNDIFSQKGDGWEEKTIDEISTVVNGYSFKSKDFSADNEIKSIKITNVGIMEFVEDLSNNLPASFSKEYSKVKVHEGDLVLALTRTIISGGLKVARVPESYHNSLLNQRVAAIVPNLKLVNSDYLYYYFSSNIVYNYVLANVNTLMQPNLSIKDLKRMTIPITSIEGQSKISTQIEKLSEKTNSLINNYEVKLNDLEELKKSILQKAFSGELTQKEVVV